MNSHLLQHFQVSPAQEFFLELVLAGYPSSFEKSRASVQWSGATAHLEGHDYQHLFNVGVLGWIGEGIGVTQMMVVKVDDILCDEGICRMLRYPSGLNGDELNAVECDWQLLKILGLTTDMNPEPFKIVPIP